MNPISTKPVGEFEVRNGAVVVSDPCYDRGTWCAGTIRNVLNGTWKARIERSDEGEWGIRVARLVVMHEKYEEDHPCVDGWDAQKFEVGVDSGQAGVFDTRHYKSDADARKATWVNKDEAICDDEPWYSLCCDRTLNGDSAGVIPFGAVSSSGFGDGGYPCHAKTEGGKVVGIAITFIGEDDEGGDDE